MSKMETANEIFLTLCRHLTSCNLETQISNVFAQLSDNRARLEYAYELLEKFDMFPKLGAFTGGKSDENCELLMSETKENLNRKHVALEMFSRAIGNGIANSENLGKAYVGRSEVLFKLGKFPECVEDLQRALKCENINEAQIKSKILQYQAAGGEQSEKIGAQILPQITHNVNDRIACAGDSVTINKSSECGRFVIATKDIKIGDVIAVEEPYAAIVLVEPNISTTHCHRCLKFSYGLMPCSHCTFSFFCSTECKDQAWQSYHQYECPIMDMLIALEVPKLMLLALRIAILAAPEYGNIHKYSAETSLEEEKYESSRYKEIHELCTNTELRTIADLFKRSVNAALIYGLLRRNTDFFRSDENKKIEKNKEIFKELLLRHMQTAPSNCHEISERVISSAKVPGDEFCEEIGSGAYSFLSMLNHSCSPNVVRHCYGTTIVLRALSPITKGEQLFDNYGYHYAVMSLPDRRKQLKSQYLFECKCQACIKNWPMYDSLRVIKGQPEISLEEIETISCLNFNQEIVLKILDGLLKKAEALEKFKPCKNLADVQECIKECYCVLGNKKVP